MSDQEGRDSVWSRPDNDDVVLVPPTPAQSEQPATAPIVRPGHPDHPDAPTGLITARHDVRGGLFSRGEPVAVGRFSDAPAPPRAPRLAWFLGAAGVLVVIGLVVVIVMASTGSLGGGVRLPLGAQKSDGPPLAQACPPPTATSDPGYHEGPAAPPGPRTVDSTAGISYKRYGSPWQAWTQDWTAGQLKVHYRTGQGFITEQYAMGTYWASILSGTVPATVNDGNILDLKCVGQQIVADVRGSGANDSGYYPQPNTMDKIEDKLTTIGGLPAYVSIFRLHFDDSKEGLKSKSELVGVATFDVGKPTAAILYVSIPETASKNDWVVKDAISSVRVAN